MIKKSISYKIQKKNRERKWRLFLKHLKPNKDSKVLDVGFNEYEYRDTVNYLEKNYPYQNNITALGIFENSPRFSERYPKVEIVNYDGAIFPFANKSFDICWSNAVIEHVGEKNNQIRFLKEIKRVSKKAFITSPNKLFPIEIHNRIPLLHILLPKKIFDKFLFRIGKTSFTGDNLNLLTMWQLKKCLKKAGISNYTIIRNRFLFFFTIDFVVIF